ncbi:LamG domain-containing protein [Actinotalea sp. K2]|nr:LamG domain-containing protein [Actinotalea sp. K2]
MADFDSTTGWPGGGLWDPINTQTVAHKSTCAGHPVRWIGWDATRQAQAIADADTAQGSLGLAVNESSMAYWQRYRNDATFSVVYNRPPNTPTGATMTNPTQACGGRPYIRTSTPTLNAVLTDPDGGNLQAKFWIYDVSTGANVWNPALTAAKASGSTFSIAVASGLFTEGRVYQWRVQARDPGGLTSAYVACEFIPDWTPPKTPGVTAVAGQPAVYVEDAWSGGIGKAGKFTFTNAGSTDVTKYLYSFDNIALEFSVAASNPTVPYLPSTNDLGPHTLRVQAMDRAGNTSPVRTYRFNVTFAGVSALWMMDEGAGALVADTGPGGNRYPLSLTPSTSWTQGPLAVLADDPSDRALLFDAASDVASTSGPVISTLDSFSVMATVRLDRAPIGSASAVSQDGVSQSGFSLGYRRPSDCPDTTTGCWSFFMYAADTVSTPVQVVSQVPIKTDSWVHLTGIHDAASDLLQLFVCEIGSVDESGDQVPVASPKVPFQSTWNATGPLAIGRGQHAGSVARPWTGAVADVQVLDGVVGQAQILRACHRTFSNSVD